MEKNQGRDLLIINDQLIRQKYFSEAHDVLVEIDRMENKIKTFHSTDQRLFEQWHKLTFQKDEIQVEKAQKEFHHLAQFHNWIVATAKMLDIEMAEAYALMKEEERRWNLGDSEVRQRIDLERQARDAFIQSEIHHRYNEAPKFENADGSESEIGSHFREVLDHLEEMVFRQEAEALQTLKLEQRIQRFMDLPDEELKYWLKDHEAAFLFFDVSLSWGETQSDHRFFLRIWDLMARKQKVTFSEIYAALTGQPIEEFLERIRGSADETEEELDLDEDPAPSPNRRERRAKKSNPLQEEKLKSLYRKLIRQLHPDIHASSSTKDSSWRNRIWEMVQQSYQKRDLSALERLLKLTLVRLEALDQLSLDEISDARLMLEKDLNNLKKEARHLKRMPAWDFSVRKDRSNLIQRIKMEFDARIGSIRRQIEELQAEHRILEMLLSVEHSQQGAQRDRENSRGRRRKMRNSDEYSF